jgi:hypothetical protein
LGLQQREFVFDPSLLDPRGICHYLHDSFRGNMRGISFGCLP